MNNKKIVVLLKYFKGELNPFDASALECALRLGAKDLTVLAMAPLSEKGNLETLTRLGVKAVLVSDIKYAGSDTIATSLILATALKKLNPDLIFCGRQSVDGDTAQIPPMLSQRLGYDIVTEIMDIDGEKVYTRSFSQTISDRKTIFAFEKSFSLRFPSIFSKKGEVDIWDNNILNIDPDLCGLKGSPTKVINCYESTVGRRFCEFVAVDKLDELIKSAVKKENKKEQIEVAEKLDVIHYIGKVQSVAKAISNNAIEIQVNGKHVNEIAQYIIESKVKNILIEDDKDYKILASRLAVVLNAGLCADCISFSVKNGNLIMTRPAQGGNVTADITSISTVTMATVRTVKKEESEIIFSVGKGAIEHLDNIKKLADKYRATICCSRTVADSGKLAYSCQVGLTGKRVSPKVYVCFGISGAVQHTCAITGAGTIIAINCDKDARIFDYADFGIVTDVKNVF